MARFTKSGDRKVIATNVDAVLWDNMKKYLESDKSRFRTIGHFMDSAIEWALENLGHEYEEEE